MLKSFEEQLKRIAAETHEDFHQRVRKRIGKRATAALEQRLKDLILLTPRILLNAHRYGASAEVPSEVKKLIGFALTYFYHPQDFLSENDGKLFSYLDDAYCVALVYEKILKSLVRAKRQMSAFDRDFLARLSLLKRGINLVMPVEVREINQMIEEIQAGKKQSFYEAIH